MTSVYVLPFEQVVHVINAAIALEFGGQRRHLLLDAIPREVVDGIRKFDREVDQLHADLFAVARDQDHLRAWLKVALSLSGERSELAIPFQEAIASIGEEQHSPQALVL